MTINEAKKILKEHNYIIFNQLNEENEENKDDKKIARDWELNEFENEVIEYAKTEIDKFFKDPTYHNKLSYAYFEMEKKDLIETICDKCFNLDQLWRH